MELRYCCFDFRTISQILRKRCWVGVSALPQGGDEKKTIDPTRSQFNILRQIVALVEIDGEEREMVFLTNNLEWSPRSVADLYLLACDRSFDAPLHGREGSRRCSHGRIDLASTIKQAP